jgi:hypothetical protein
MLRMSSTTFRAYLTFSAFRWVTTSKITFVHNIEQYRRTQAARKADKEAASGGQGLLTSAIHDRIDVWL